MGAGGDRGRHRVAGVVEPVGEVECQRCRNQQNQDDHFCAHNRDSAGSRAALQSCGGHHGASTRQLPNRRNVFIYCSTVCFQALADTEADPVQQSSGAPARDEHLDVHRAPRTPRPGSGRGERFPRKDRGWLKAGYPEGVPQTDYIPLFALLPRRLTDDEVQGRRHALIDRDEFDHIEIGVLITEMTDGCPSRKTSSGSGISWPPRAGRSTTHARARTPNSRPASARRPARPLGTVAAGRAGRRTGRPRCPPGADPSRRSSPRVSC